MQETQVLSLDHKDPLEKEMATHFRILAWKIPWTEEPGGLQSIELDTTERLHFHFSLGNSLCHRHGLFVKLPCSAWSERLHRSTAVLWTLLSGWCSGELSQRETLGLESEFSKTKTGFPFFRISK